MRKISSQKIDVDYYGENCSVVVHDFISIKGSYSFSAPSDLDYRGYNEISWDFFSESEEDYWKNHCADNEINWNWFHDVIEDKLIEKILEMKEGEEYDYN